MMDAWLAEGGTQAGALRPETQRIVHAASEFLWSPELTASVEAFTAEHAPLFAGAAQGEAGLAQEQRLEWTEAHLGFCRLFEEQLEAFISAQPFSRGEFVDACQDALDASGDGGGGGAAGFAASVVETVLMGSQYEYFVQTMAAAAAHDRQRRELGVDTVTVLDGAVAEAQAAGEGDEAAPEPEQLTQIPLPAAE